MSADQVEQRLAAIERAVTDLHRRLDEVPGVPQRQNWWERLGPPLTPEESAGLDAASAYGRYWRKTGREAPPEWRPGDAIPEPEYDE